MAAKSWTSTIADLFRPEPPLWSCEFTSKHVIASGVDGSRTKIQGKRAASAPAGALNVSLTETNIRNPEAIRPIVDETLQSAGFKGSEIALVIPDETARIAFVTADSLPGDDEEKRTFIRWKLKKTVPFDVDTAQIAYRVLGRREGGSATLSEGPGGKGAIELLVALCPHSIVREYEGLMDKLDLHAGLILPSTLAALNLFETPKDDALFVKLAPDCVTTTIFQGGRIRFYRRVAGQNLYDSVYPTVLYYQDKLEGQSLGKICFCGYDEDMRPALADLQDKLKIPVTPLAPKAVEDIYKPALGAIHLSWENLI